jgi:hypothetical protein
VTQNLVFGFILMGMRTSITACFLVVGLAACRGSSGPDITGDTFVLRSVSGQQLPAPFAPNPSSNTLVVAETLVFAANNVGEQRATYADPAGSRWEVRTRFTYARAGDAMEISFVCADNASCIEPPHLVGTVTSTELLINSSRVTRVPLRFERVPPGNSPSYTATVGQDFVLAPRQNASISSTGLMVRFERVTADSRCPRDVTCVWSGSAALRLEIVKNGIPQWAGTLNTHEEPRQVALGDHELRVIALTPDPVSTKPIQENEYRLTLRVTAVQP